MTERINVERTSSSKRRPFFAINLEDFVESEETQREVVRVGNTSTELYVTSFGVFKLQSKRPTVVEGTYERRGASIKVNMPGDIEAHEVLEAEYRFGVTKENWVEFISWDGKTKLKLTILEDLPIQEGVLASEQDPDPTLHTSVQLEAKSLERVLQKV